MNSLSRQHAKSHSHQQHQIRAVVRSNIRLNLKCGTRFLAHKCRGIQESSEHHPCPYAVQTPIARQLLFLLTSGNIGLLEASVESHVSQLQEQKQAEVEHQKNYQASDELYAQLQARIFKDKEHNRRLTVSEMMYVLVLARLEEAGAELLKRVDSLQVIGNDAATGPPLKQAESTSPYMADDAKMVKICGRLTMMLIKSKFGVNIPSSPPFPSVSPPSATASSAPSFTESPSGSTSSATSASSAASGSGRESESEDDAFTSPESLLRSSRSGDMPSGRSLLDSIRRSWKAEDYAAQEEENRWWQDFMSERRSNEEASSSPEERAQVTALKVMVQNRRLAALAYLNAIRLGYMARRLARIIEHFQSSGKVDLEALKIGASQEFASEEASTIASRHVGALWGLTMSQDPLTGSLQPYPELEMTSGALADLVRGKYGSSEAWSTHMGEVAQRRLKSTSLRGLLHDDPDIVCLFANAMQQIIQEALIFGVILWDTEHEFVSKYEWLINSVKKI